MSTAFEIATAFVKQHEALRLKAYDDARPNYDLKLDDDCEGTCTIGYGETLSVLPGMTITEKQAEEWLSDRLKRCEQLVLQGVSVPLNDNQIAALISFIYNIGVTAWRTKCSVRAKLNGGMRQRALDTLLAWNKRTIKGQKVVSAGLANRRKAERALFETPIT